MEKNNIHFIDDLAFNHNGRLRILNLNGNSVHPSAWLQPLFARLGTLQMTGGQVDDLADLQLLLFEDLHRIHLSHNNIGPVIQGDLFPKSLHAIRIIRCGTTKLENMSHLERLHTLFVQRNDMTSLPDLSHLPLNDGGLKMTSEHPLSYFSRMQRIQYSKLTDQSH